MPIAKTPANPASNVHKTDGVYAYATLQALLFDHPDLPYIPILPLATLSGLPELLKSHAQAIAQGLPTGKRTHGSSPSTAKTSTRHILQSCTTEPPLPPLAVDLITDIFPSLGALVSEATALKAVNTDAKSREEEGWVSGSDVVVLREELQPGLEVLRDQLGERVVTGLVEFWEDEWAVE